MKQASAASSFRQHGGRLVCQLGLDRPEVLDETGERSEQFQTARRPVGLVFSNLLVVNSSKEIFWGVGAGYAGGCEEAGRRADLGA